MKKLYYIFIVSVSLLFFSCGVQSVATQQSYDDLYVTSENQLVNNSSLAEQQGLTKSNAQDLDTIDLLSSPQYAKSYKDTTDGYFYLDDDTYDTRMRLLYGGYYPEYNFYYYDYDPWMWDTYWYRPYSRVTIYYGYGYPYWSGYYWSYWNGYRDGYWDGYWDGTWGIYRDPWYYSWSPWYYPNSWYYGSYYYYRNNNEYDTRGRTFGHRVSSSVTASSTPRTRNSYNGTLKRDRLDNTARVTNSNARSQTRAYQTRNTQASVSRSRLMQQSDARSRYSDGNSYQVGRNLDANYRRDANNIHGRTRNGNSYLNQRRVNYSSGRNTSSRVIGRTYRASSVTKRNYSHYNTGNEYRTYTRPSYNRSNSYSHSNYSRPRTSSYNYRSSSYSRGTSFSSGRSSSFSTGSHSSRSSGSNSSGRRR